MVELRFNRVAVLGATGPTGYHLTRRLLAGGAKVRVLSRRRDGLERRFAGLDVEKAAADATDLDSTRRGIEACDLVFDCVGLPDDRMHLHPAIARSVAVAVRSIAARCVLISSYWAYLPLVRSRLDESHPRNDGTSWVRYRRDAEDILQQALVESAADRVVNWIGGPDIGREYIFVPDAMVLAAEVSTRPKAYGERWVLPGAGALTANDLARIAGRHLRRHVKIRSAGPVLLRLASLFNRPLRRFLPMVRHYVKPIAYDATKLRGLIGGWSLTGYETGIAETLDWIVSATRD